MPRRFFCRGFAGFEVDVWRHVLRVGLTNSENKFVDVQEANRRLYTAVRNPRFLSLDARSRMDFFLLHNFGSAGRKPCLVDPLGETLSIRHAGGHDSARVNVNELDHQFIGHVPTHFPHSSSPTRLCIFEGNASVMHTKSSGTCCSQPALKH